MVPLDGVRARTLEPLFRACGPLVHAGRSPPRGQAPCPHGLPAHAQPEKSVPHAPAPHAPAKPSYVTRACVKSPGLLVAESGADLEGHGLRRAMGLFQLVRFGVGAIVGTGIFVGLSGSVAEAGPAVVVSFVLAAITCILTAFSFAELGGAAATRR